MRQAEGLQNERASVEPACGSGQGVGKVCHCKHKNEGDRKGRKEGVVLKK